jgi:secreted trypsin-like serine protease
VLTAGHAFERGFSHILIGDDFQAPSSARPPIKVIKAVIHPQFGFDPDPNHPTFVNDLTVLILERAVKPEEAKPRAVAEETDVLAATSGMVVGFGSTGDLTIPNAGAGRKRSVEIPLASYACDKNVDGVAETDAFGCVSDRELVAADPLRRKDSCEGDSGGPLYVKRNGEWFLAGATSRGTKRNGDDLDANGLPLICGLGGIYVRVDKYMDWIREVANANNVEGP